MVGKFTAFLANRKAIKPLIGLGMGKMGKRGDLIPQEGKNPRKLTPRECAKLQGFPKNYILPDSNAASYKQFGNSVAVPVIEKITREIVKYLNK